MNLTDTHAHLYWDSFKNDFDEMIQRALDSGVKTIINVGVGIEESKKASEQVKTVKWPENLRVYSTISIHPHESYKYINNTDVSIHQDIEKLEQIYQSAPDHIVAIGECGLDYYFENAEFYPGITISPMDAKILQQKLFQAQIDLAKKLELPLIIHCRDDRSKNPENTEAWDKVLDMVGDHPTLLHCYSGLIPTTKKILERKNIYVSFAATITYPKNDHLKEAASLLPIDRIMVETDSPFLPPQSKRGTRNEPSNIVETAEAVATIKNLSLEEFAEQTSHNAFVFFKLNH